MCRRSAAALAPDRCLTVTALAVALLCCACSTVEPGRPVALSGLPDRFKAGTATPGPARTAGAASRHQAPGARLAEAPAQAGWWRLFEDPALDRLVERAEAANTDIAMATARLLQARALVDAAQAKGRVQIQAVASASRQGGPLVNAAGSSGGLFTATLGVSYEPDLFGRLASERGVAGLDAGAREALLHHTRLLVQADVTQTYLLLRACDAERALLRQALASQGETAALVGLQVRRGSRAAVALQPLKVEQAEAEAELSALDGRRDKLEHALATLLGEPAPAFSLPAQPEAAAFAKVPEVPAGIPSQVLARRPDVSAAQQAWMAAQLRSGQARSAWFPEVVLTGSGGQASADLGSLLKSSLRAWALGAVLVAPLIDGGQRDAAIRQADAEADAAGAAARERMLVALREVQDQLSGLQALASQSAWQAEAQAVQAQAVVLAEQRWRQGNLSRYEVLFAQRSSLASQRQALQLAAQRQLTTVALVRALGGGWEPTPPEPDQRVAGP